MHFFVLGKGFANLLFQPTLNEFPVGRSRMAPSEFELIFAEAKFRTDLGFVSNFAVGRTPN